MLPWYTSEPQSAMCTRSRSGYCINQNNFWEENSETRTWKYFNLSLNKHETFKSYRRDSDVIRRFADGSTNLVLKPGFFLNDDLSKRLTIPNVTMLNVTFDF